MLELVRRTGTEFGIAVIMSSHLLGEIERVCDHVVAIDGGRLLRSAPTGELHRSDRLAARRGGRGCRRRSRRRSPLGGLTATADGDAPDRRRGSDRDRDRGRRPRRELADRGRALIRLEVIRARVEDLFRDGPEAGPGAAA